MVNFTLKIFIKHIDGHIYQLQNQARRNFVTNLAKLRQLRTQNQVIEKKNGESRKAVILLKLNKSQKISRYFFKKCNNFSESTWSVPSASISSLNGA